MVEITKIGFLVILVIQPSKALVSGTKYRGCKVIPSVIRDTGLVLRKLKSFIKQLGHVLDPRCLSPLEK